MSTATKVVMGTLAVAVVLSLVLVGNLALV
jgi:hypothetical protein